MNLLQSLANHTQRIGFHYYPDNFHYRESDLGTWLPELKAMGAGWLFLNSSPLRAIPENFISQLVAAGIEPVIQFADLPLNEPLDTDLLAPLLHSYARWGCKIVQFYQRPNDKPAWKGDWSQRDLVERFLDRWLPLANLTFQNGMAPLFPALEPGGAYWDTAFLLGALEGLKRRRQNDIIENLVLSAYGWSFRHSLNWGSGGPARWRESRPYHTPANSQDQRGFRAYEWYQTIAEAILGRVYPAIILQAGLDRCPSQHQTNEDFFLRQANNGLSLARLAEHQPSTDPLHPDTMLEPLPASILACSFYCLTAAPSSPHLGLAWYPAEGISAPAVQALKTFHAQQIAKTKLTNQTPPGVNSSSENHLTNNVQPKNADHPLHIIDHYLLIPSFEWGISDYHLEVIRPFVKKHRPTIGFSVDEAASSKRVTVLNDALTFPDDLLTKLHQSGCQVDWINASGTEIASLLSQR